MVFVFLHRCLIYDVVVVVGGFFCCCCSTLLELSYDLTCHDGHLSRTEDVDDGVKAFVYDDGAMHRNDLDVCVAMSCHHGRPMAVAMVHLEAISSSRVVAGLAVVVVSSVPSVVVGMEAMERFSRTQESK